MADPQLKFVKIDSDAKESLLGLAADRMGRLFVGGREGLFVSEPDPSGLYLLTLKNGDETSGLIFKTLDGLSDLLAFFLTQKN